MNAAIWSFTKPTENSVVASNRIATFLQDTLQLPLYHDGHILDEKRLDVLIMVNGAFAFCAFRDEVAKVIRRTPRIIWVQNDYTIYTPTDSGTAETPFRKAFRTRVQDKGFAPVDRWTTVADLATVTPGSRYVNWNMLTALPKPLNRGVLGVPPLEALFYYGAYRNGREEAFDRFFTKPVAATVVSSPSKKFAARYPKIQVVSPIGGEQFYPTLNAHALGLYLEDERSHRQFHSPANRFYEMLSAGLPMVFQAESVAMLRDYANINVSDYVVRGPKGVAAVLPDHERIGTEQRERWWQPFRKRLTKQVQKLWTEYTRGL
jgi:hypothetical protein